MCYYYHLEIYRIYAVQVTLQSLGAAAAIASTYVTEWGDGYQGGNVGGLLAAMLSPTGGFGKFLTFLLSLSVAGNIAFTFYSFCLNLQVFMPFLVVVPRYTFSIVATAMSVTPQFIYFSFCNVDMTLPESFRYLSWVLTSSTSRFQISWVSSDTGLARTLGSSWWNISSSGGMISSSTMSGIGTRHDCCRQASPPLELVSRRSA